MQDRSSKTPSPFRRVLLATNLGEGSEEVLRAALQFCQRSDATLRILHVSRPHAPLDQDKAEFAGFLAPPRSLDQQASELLREARERALSLGLHCITRQESGVPAERILKALEAEETDLLILGTGEPHGSVRNAFGPTAEKVMLQAACPIMTVGRVAAETVQTYPSDGSVLFATDFHSCTRQAINHAIRYSRSIHQQLHCAHVLPRTLQSIHGDNTLAELLTNALKHLVTTNNTSDQDTICKVIYGSEISNAIVNYARQIQAGIIFLGIRSDSILSCQDRLPIAFRIIVESPCPVVTIVCDSEAEPENVTDSEVRNFEAPPSFLQ
ncbi:MAG: universal stress protein [Acidobacteriota bacterium]